MTLSLHKLWAGSGYEYLTRQVARQDVTHPGRELLSSYYSERGESPGLWVGSGLAGVQGLAGGDVVTSEQMRFLFGRGLHPLADARGEAALAAGALTAEAVRAGLLGAPFRGRSTTDGSFDAEVAQRLAARTAVTADGSAAAGAVRAEVVSELAAEWFERNHGRAPGDDRELWAAVARWSRGPAQPVAGFDLTFSPVKSVSALWAVAPPPVTAELERCHRAAVEDALRFVEERALFSREGARGVRQVDVTGLVGAAFTHRDSRAGDPDLHTHVAVANKVQTREGKWLSIDGRTLYAATVTASETYNTALERHLGERLGLRFAARPGDERGVRPVREVVGVDPRLLKAWSSRRRDIDVRRADLARAFLQRSRRPPTRREAWALAQQATLETRPAKHEPRTLAEQRAAWATQADALLGTRRAVETMVARTLAPQPDVARTVDATCVAETASRVVSVMETERATWSVWHLQAEAQRHVRALDVPPGMVEHVVDLVVGEATNRCLPLNPPTAVEVPAELRRTDGSSVYEVVGTKRWTSTRVLAAEEQILTAAQLHDGRRVETGTVEVALREAALEGPGLNAGQVGLVRDLAGSGARVQLALAPAGTGKTTALRVLAQSWTTAGGNVVGLAPSAAAAGVLGEQLKGPTDTLAKLVWSLDHSANRPAWMGRLDPGSLVVIDEAGLADSPSLARAIGHVLKVGGSVRLVGDDQQLGAVGAGGLLRDLAARVGAARLDDVVRFSDPAEAAASLALRDGRPEALGFYLDEHRVHVGDATTAADHLFAAWNTDRIAGLDTVMLAPTRDLVADLNARARSARLTTATSSALNLQTPGSSALSPPGPVPPEVGLADQNQASVGDIVVTRTNDRRLTTNRRTTGRRWVRNGDRWTVTHVYRDGRLAVSSLRDGQHVTLPADYVQASVELGYASTIHAAQGSTCDTVHGLLSGQETRAQLYTLLTRGRTANHAYLQLEPDAGTYELTGPDAEPLRTATQVLEQILTRESDDRSATGLRDDLHDPALRLPDEVDRYLDSLHLGVDHTTRPEVDLKLTATAERLVPGLTDEPAWPTLRSHLLLHGATTGSDPAHHLTLAVALRPLDDPDDPAHDRAAVLHHRIAARQPPPTGGPLPWLPPIPGQLLDHPTWGPYLTARAGLLGELARTVGARAEGEGRVWAASVPRELSRRTFADVATWRAAQRIPASDPDPLGPRPADPAPQSWYQHLETATTTVEPDQVKSLLPTTAGTATDPYRAQLGRNLARLTDHIQLLEPAMQAAAAKKPLPDDHASAALWWRLHRHLPPDAFKTVEQAKTRQHDTTATADAALPASPTTQSQRVDLALLVAGLLRLCRPAPSAAHKEVQVPPGRRDELLHVNELTLQYYRSQYPRSWSARYLAERCGTDLNDDPRFFPAHAPAGWTNLVDHLREQGIADQDMLDAGVARRSSRGHLIDLFRDRLVVPIWNNEHDLVGFVARRRDNSQTVEGGFDGQGPKYLNTPTTALYSKTHHLYGAHLIAPLSENTAANPDRPGTASGPPVPVLVEGPIDAIAINLAANNGYVGLATLGTAFTDNHAALLARYKTDPILALDADPAGTAATRRAFWTLTSANLDPHIATPPANTDPADLYRRAGAVGIRKMLDQTEPLASQLTRNVFDTAPPQDQIDAQLRIAAARPPHTWADSLDRLTEQHGVNPDRLREQLLKRLQADPAEARPRRPLPPSQQAGDVGGLGPTRRISRTPLQTANSTNSPIDAPRRTPPSTSQRR